MCIYLCPYSVAALMKAHRAPQSEWRELQIGLSACAKIGCDGWFGGGRGW